MSFVDLRSLVTFAPSPVRWPTALRAALVILLPLAVSMATGHGTTGFLTSLGSFAVLYGAGTPVRRRAQVIGGVGAGLVLCAGAGTLVAGSPWGTFVVLVLLAGAVAFVMHALRVGPPGVFFPVLSAGVANAAVDGGRDPLQVLALAVTGAVIALVVGTSDAWTGDHRFERAAVAHAERQVELFEAVDRMDPRAFDRRRGEASRALHAAWTTVTDSVRGRRPDGELTDRLGAVHDRYVAMTGRVAGHLAGVDVRLWEEPVDQVDPERDERAGDLRRGPLERQQVERTRLRYATLGRPPAAYLLRQAAWWPSESMLVAARVVGAAALAGGITTAIGNLHVYWAVAFAALIVQAGGSRRAQATKAMHRILGTFAGLAVFAVVLEVDLDGWWLVLFVTVLQGAVELVVTRHYALAVTLITPLAMTISAAVTGMDTEIVVGDRVLDTMIGVGCAILVLLATGIGRHEVVLRAHARRVVHAIDAVLADLIGESREPESAGRPAGRPGARPAGARAEDRVQGQVEDRVEELRDDQAEERAGDQAEGQVAERVGDQAEGQAEERAGHQAEDQVEQRSARRDEPSHALRRQHLYVELLDSDAIARRALADAPRAVAPFREMERVLSHVGYLVLGAAWHEHVWGRPERFARAREALESITSRRVTERRDADEITADLKAVERALTGQA